ncbi:MULTISPECIES: DUF945 domain-containing protein [Rhizobium]|uniref:DUF945 domain-containing protein n=1 Tax=Rhizobium rhododendri TaxID=2506430 RepID=A0ABY8IJ68_9HYPH|nr:MULTISPECIES: DUF945 domain-containing protein [Rhizobium]MBZ5760112.1 YdgA family protein [Rhizobium sp. VS19-DR96]MBZ5766407.1 YdgA family protein [Rhizobium sp. VS19-DR129.2]MBZ5774250.1 YdgA family protein [Rhizobium sp. VS19-DRK62.2]MBZ5785322.1 YdgA family protein [Rhizobium sp. VS19-DR121]MBZ5802921.1 YdgA family protein [Rhizobium sp. VS19-DR181]
MTFYRTTRLMLSSAAILSLASSAFALDGNDLLKKMNAAYAIQGVSLAADSVEVDDTTVTLKGASFKPLSGGQGVPLGKVTMSDVTEESDGGYAIDKVTFPDISVTNEGVTYTASDMFLGGVTVPADANAEGIDGMLLYSKAHTGPLAVTKEGKEVLSVKDMDFALTPTHDDSGFEFTGNVNAIKADLSDVKDPASQDTINKLALQHVSGALTMKGSWDIKPGTVTVEDLGLDLDNIGRLDLSLAISGYTMEFMKSLQEAAKAAQANPDKQAAQQATGLAMMGLMQQLTLDSAEIHFKDASITKRLLDYAGSTQNVSGAQMANTLKGLAPIMLAQLNIPELQNSVSAAINSYLDNPQSFTLNASPEKPVPFPMIVGAAMGAPNTIPKVIGLKVSAND